MVYGSSLYYIIIKLSIIIIIIPYYMYTPANELKNDNFKLYWNRSIITDKTIPANRPDINFTNKKKTTYFIHIAVPNTHNLAKTITEKQSEYQELANEICAMWK